MAVRVMQSPDGRLYEVAADEADTLVRDQGWQVAPEAAVAQRTQEREQWQKYGGAGQQALGLAETAVRSGTLGLVTGLEGDETEQRERAAVVAEDSPVLNAVAGAAPAVAAGIATGGAGLGVAGTIAAEAALGGIGGVGAAADEAFRHDQELSAEAAFGSFASGALLGGATAGALAGGAKVLGAARNRFIEASGKAARKAEAEAFAAAGITRPVKGLDGAMADPVKRAGMREAGAAARPKVAAEMPDHLRAMEQAEQAARAYQPGSMPFPDELAPAQRNAVRWVLKGAQEELAPANPALGGRLERVLEALDRSNTSDEIFTTARALRASLDDMLETAETPEVAKLLKQHAARARKLEADDGLFGKPAAAVGVDQQVLDDLAESREGLRTALDGKNYLDVIGTADGDAIEAALDTYSTRLEGALKSVDTPEAKAGLDAAARLRQLRDGDLRTVAGGNQAKLVGGAELPKTQSPMHDLLGEAAETAVEAAIPGFGMVRKAWKYRKHIARLAGVTRTDAESIAKRLVRGIDAVPRVRGAGAAVGALGARTLGERGDLMFAGVGDTPENAYRKIRSSVERLAKEPERLADELAANMGDMSTEAPELLSMVNEKAARAVSFLQSKIPPAFGFAMLYPDGPPPSRSDMLELSLYWRGVTDPDDVAQAIASGSAMPEEVEAFRAVNPVRFVELQDATAAEVALAAQDGLVLGGYKIAEIENLLDMHGKLDPTFSQSIADVARMQDEAELAQQEQVANYAPQPKAGQRISQDSPAV